MTDDEDLEVGEEALLGPSLADCNFRFFVPRKYGESGGSSCELFSHMNQMCPSVKFFY